MSLLRIITITANCNRGIRDKPPVSEYQALENIHTLSRFSLSIMEL